MSAPDPHDHTASPPTVSIVMANYNGAAHLADAIGSAQSQSLRDLEIIVSDDASSDDSVRIVKQFIAEDPRIRLVHSHQNGGPAAARNRALAMAMQAGWSFGFFAGLMSASSLVNSANSLGGTKGEVPKRDRITR